MSESQYLSIIRIWAAMAWADGVIADAEAVAMKRLIESAELSEDEQQTALGWLESKVELEPEGVSDLGESARLGVYRAAARLAAVDLEVADEEKVFLRRLREVLTIDEETARQIEADIPGHN